MTRIWHLWHALVAALLAANAVCPGLTATPFGGQRGSSTANRYQVTIPAASNDPCASPIKSASHRSLQSAHLMGVDATASTAATSSAHKQLLPLSARDVLLFILVAGTLALAAASGIGGGVLLVPLLSMVGGFQFIEAVALSNVACLASAVTNLMFNISRKNPVKPGPLIDYDLLLLFGPPIVMGSVAGAKANYFIPSWITETLLLLVLAPMVWRMVNKAKFLWVAENDFECQALADIHAAAADTDVDSIKAAAEGAEAAEDGACCVADDAGPGTLKSAPAAVTACVPGAGLRTTQSSLRQVARGPRRCSSAAAVVGKPVADDLSNDLRRAFSDNHEAPHARPQHNSRHNMCPSPMSKPSTDLVDVVGPELMLLTSPAAATATVQVQQGRELQMQRLGFSCSVQSELFSSFTVSEDSVLGLPGSGFRAQSMATVRGNGWFAASRSSSWVGAGGAGAGTGGAMRLGLSADAARFLDGAAAADVLPAAASAPAGGVGGSIASHNSSPSRRSAPVHHQQQQRLMPGAETGYGTCDQLDMATDLAGGCSTADAMTPFALHQLQLSFRQDSLKRPGSGSQQGGSFASRCSSMGPAGSITAGHGQYTIRQLYSPDEEEAVQRKAVQVKAARGEGTTAGGKDVELPVAGKSHCLRLNHDDCCHTPELEDLMMRRIEYHMLHQYPKLHFAALLGMLLLVVATAVCSQFLLQCGTWQFWLVVLSPIPTMTIIWALTRWHVLWRVGWQECLGLMSQAEIEWTPRSTLVYPAVCTSVGVLAGLLGIGGGTMMAPMLLELGVHPQTSAASSQAAILISTATAAVVYLVNGSVPQDYGITIILIGLFATLLGQTAITHLVRRTGRNSLLVFILAFLFVAALVLCVAAVGLAVARIVADASLLMATRKYAVCHMSKAA